MPGTWRKTKWPHYYTDIQNVIWLSIMFPSQGSTKPHLAFSVKLLRDVAKMTITIFVLTRKGTRIPFRLHEDSEYLDSCTTTIPFTFVRHFIRSDCFKCLSSIFRPNSPVVVSRFPLYTGQDLKALSWWIGNLTRRPNFFKSHVSLNTLLRLI